MGSKRISVFKEDGLEKLSFEYVPSRLPHREQFVDDLIKFLRIAVDNPAEDLQKYCCHDY